MFGKLCIRQDDDDDNDDDDNDDDDDDDAIPFVHNRTDSSSLHATDGHNQAVVDSVL